MDRHGVFNSLADMVLLPLHCAAPRRVHARDMRVAHTRADTPACAAAGTRRATRGIATQRAGLACVLALALALAGVPTEASAQWVAPARLADGDPPDLSALAVTGQVTLGTVGTVAGFVGGGLATRWVARRAGATEGRASQLAMVGAYTGAALVTPVAPVLIGSRDGASGSYPAALAGTLAGGAASVLLVYAGRHGAFDCRACTPLRWLAGAAIVVLPSVGATVAFDASRE